MMESHQPICFDISNLRQIIKCISEAPSEAQYNVSTSGGSALTMWIDQLDHFTTVLMTELDWLGQMVAETKYAKIGVNVDAIHSLIASLMTDTKNLSDHVKIIDSDPLSMMGVVTHGKHTNDIIKHMKESYRMIKDELLVQPLINAITEPSAEVHSMSTNIEPPDTPTTETPVAAKSGVQSSVPFHLGD